MVHTYVYKKKKNNNKYSTKIKKNGKYFYFILTVQYQFLTIQGNLYNIQHAIEKVLTLENLLLKNIQLHTKFNFLEIFT